MSKTIPQAGAQVLQAYLSVSAADRQLTELNGHAVKAQDIIKALVASFANDENTPDSVLRLHGEKAAQVEVLEELNSALEIIEAQLTDALEDLQQTLNAYGDACVIAGIPRPALRGNIFVRYLSAGSTGLLGSEKEAHACRFGDAWARASADTFFHAKRSFAYEEVTIKLDGAKIFK